MSLEKANITWSAKQLAAMVKTGKINFDHIVQRSYVWERSRKTGLIESMLLGYPVPPIFAKRLDDGTGKRGGNIYYIMDGKQRLSTVKEFLNDEFALTTINPVTYYNEAFDDDCEEDISGLKFSELPEVLQDALKDTMFSVTYFDGLTKEEERELFKRLNAGKPLSAKSRVLASCKDIETLLDIGSHRLFQDMLTDKARANKNQVSIVIKIYCMMKKDINEVSFESKVINPLIEQMEFTDYEKHELALVFDYFAAVHDALIERGEKRIAKKLYTETHLVSLVPFVARAINSAMDEDLFADWLVDFFTSENMSVSNEYNAAAGAASAKSPNIKARHHALDESFTEFFKTEDSGDSADSEEE